MATLSSSRAASTFPVFKASGAGILCAAYGTYELAANPTAADIIEFCKVPNGAVVVGGWLFGDDIDTNATETFDMDMGWAANGTDAADPDGFGNFGVITGDAVAEVKPETGISMPLGGVLLAAGPKTFSAETTIQGVVNVAAATGGTGTLTCVVHYLNP